MKNLLFVAAVLSAMAVSGSVDAQNYRSVYPSYGQRYVQPGYRMPVPNYRPPIQSSWNGYNNFRPAYNNRYQPAPRYQTPNITQPQIKPWRMAGNFVGGATGIDVNGYQRNLKTNWDNFRKPLGIETPRSFKKVAKIFGW